MKKKIIAMILAAAISCQPVMIYAADEEVEFSDDESSFVDDVQIEQPDVEESSNEEMETDIEFDNDEEKIEDEEITEEEIFSDGGEVRQEQSLENVEVFTEGFSGKGEGTVDDPYQITTCIQMNEVRNNMSAHYILNNDIDMSEIENWEPIGDEENKFTGSFDGKGHSINNLKIDGEPLRYIGLFGYSSSNASLKNIVLSNVDIKANELNKPNGYWYIGAIAAYAYNIISCTVSGSIEVTNCYNAEIGGIVGEGSNLSNCINYVNIKVIGNKDYGKDYDENYGGGTYSTHVECGGIIGRTIEIFGRVIDCTNYGDIEAESGSFLYCGGISGEYGSIQRSTNYGNIIGRTKSAESFGGSAGNCNVGGIVGAISGKALYSVNYGNINADAMVASWSTSSYAGGIAGFNGNHSNSEIKYCINAGETITSVLGDSDGKTGRIAASSDSMTECYSLDTTTLNGKIPTENIGPNDINGESVDADNIEAVIKNNYAGNNKVISTFPSNGEKNVDPQFHGSGYDISVFFDGTVSAGKGNIRVINLNTGDIKYYDVATYAKFEEDILTIPQIKLDYATKYAIQFEEGCIYVDGKSFFGFADKDTWTFETKEKEEAIADYNYSANLNKWILDQGTSNSMKYLSTNDNFVNSLMVANYDSSFLDEFIENTSNLVFGGVKGWENYWSEATKQEQARKILVSLLTSYEDDVEALSIVETAKKFADTYVATLKSGNWAYAVEYGLNSDEITRLSELCKNDNVYEFFVNGEYGKLSHYLQKVGGYASDSKIIQCVKSFSESKELAKALTDNLETFGKALTVVKVTDATVTRYFDIMRLCKADELYCDMLLYLANNSSYAPIQKAAADVYQVIQGDCLKQLEYLTKDITDTLKEKALDEALEAVTQNVSLKTIAIKSYKYSVNLANLIFNTADAQGQKDNMRCAAYIGAYLGRWMQSNKESYLNSSGDEKNQFARKTVYAYYMLLKTRMIGEQSGRKFMELLVFKKGSRQYKLSLEITSTLEAIEKALKCNGVWGSCYSSSVVACPVDVEVCDKTGKTVLTVYDGKESAGNVNGIYYNVYYHPLDEDYVKVINLPVNGGYTLKCKANDLGKVEYYVSTISKDGGVTRKEAVEIPVQKGNQIQITNISDNQPTCKLIDNNGSVKKEYTAEEKDTKQIAVTSVKATSSTLEMKKGEKKIINVNIAPENATNRELLWTSANNAIAKVNSDGVVQGVSAGSVDIKVVSVENEKIYAKIRVTVKNVETAVKKPSTPKLTKVTPSYDSITIRWNKVAGAKGYLIYRKTNTGGWKALKYTSGTSYKDKSVRVENKYTYTVKAYKVVNGKKIFGGYDKKGLTSRLTTTISLSKTKTKKIVISWKATSGASGYEIYRASSPKGKYTKIKTINGRKTVKYTDSKVKKGKTYYYKVIPFIKKGKKIIRGTSSVIKKITVK